MKKWLARFRKPKTPVLSTTDLNKPVTLPSPSPTLLGNLTSGVVNTSNWTYTTTIPTAAPAPLPGSIITSMGTGMAPGSLITAAGAAAIAGGYSTIGTFTITPPKHIVQFSNQGSEIVRLNNDGSVTWNNGIQIDEAADAFAKSISLGAELSAGITKKVKLNMRDSVFEDLIGIAKEKGSLTAEDLTYLLEASKIVEKLKGGRE